MDLIFVSMENWDDIWRRNQFVCAQIARKMPDSKILFVGIARDITNSIRRLQFAHAFKDSTSSLEEYPQITFTRPVKLAPNSLKFGRAFNNWITERHIARHAAQLGMKEPVLWLNPHSAVHLIDAVSHSAVIYDITDDWTSLTQSPALKELTISQDAEMCQRVDSVIVCSQRLYDMKARMAADLHLIPNGVDCEHYKPAFDVEVDIPSAAASWQKPVLGYTGTIHPDRVDVPLITAMATSMQSGSIALVGPSHLSEGQQKALEATGRVYFTGAVPYSQVPNYMRAFDVCITPHLVSAFTESLNPIKLWEYLAAGKPIVSTNVAGFRDYPEYVSIAQGAEEFLQAAYAAIAEEPTVPARRRAEASKHSWSSRVDAIIEVVEHARATHASASPRRLRV